MADINENVGDDDFEVPGYGCEERKKDGFVYVIVAIKGLKTSSNIVFQGMVPKKIRKPSNAKVEVAFGTQSLCVTVVGESGDMKWQKYRLKVNKLLHEIIPEQSYHEVEKGRILLYLCKKEDKSWDPQLDHGLDIPEEVPFL